MMKHWQWLLPAWAWLCVLVVTVVATVAHRRKAAWRRTQKQQAMKAALDKRAVEKAAELEKPSGPVIRARPYKQFHHWWDAYLAADRAEQRAHQLASSAGQRLDALLLPLRGRYVEVKAKLSGYGEDRRKARVTTAIGLLDHSQLRNQDGELMHIDFVANSTLAEVTQLLPEPVVLPRPDIDAAIVEMLKASSAARRAELKAKHAETAMHDYWLTCVGQYVKLTKLTRYKYSRGRRSDEMELRLDEHGRYLAEVIGRVAQIFPDRNKPAIVKIVSLKDGKAYYVAPTDGTVAELVTNYSVEPVGTVQAVAEVSSS